MTIGDLYDVIAGTNFSFLQNAKVESWPVMGHEQRWHTRLIHANTNAVARHARLRHFKFSATDAVSIADTNFIIKKSVDGEVLSELAESKIVAAQKLLPVMVRIHLVDEYCAVLTAMTGEIGLRITIDIERAHHSSSGNRRFPDGGSDRFAVPCHVPREADIYRKQSGHAYLIELQGVVNIRLTKVGARPPSTWRIAQFEIAAKDLLLLVAGAASRRRRSHECDRRWRQRVS
jgi:hypothetical protein